MDAIFNKRLPVYKVIANLENGIKAFESEDDKNVLRSKFSNIIDSYQKAPNCSVGFVDKMYKCRQKSAQVKNTIKEIGKNVAKAKQFLKENGNNIKIINADKSNKTVIMDADDYNNKMMNLLNDGDTYKRLRFDRTNKLQIENNKLVKSWSSKNYISKMEEKLLCINNAKPPKIYGLIKLHRQGYPMRPIVSCIQSPTYNLAKFLVDVLKKVVGRSSFNVKDSWSFHKYINAQRVPENYCLVSFDVVSLYTSIPIELAMCVLEDRWEEITRYTKLSKNEFLTGMKLCIDNTYFQFEDGFFEQKQGLAMGSPISACVANLTMEYLEKQVLQNLRCSIHIYKRYVDDCFLCLPKDQVEYVLDQFNSFCASLNFTMETEVNKTLNFLDITVAHCNGKITTKWFRKPNSSGRYVNYLSAQPLVHKKAVVAGLVDRAVCFTNVIDRPKVIADVKKILRDNNYPDEFVNKIIKERVHKLYNGNSKPNIQEEDKKFISFPYICGLSENIEHLLKDKFKVAHKTHTNVGQLFSKLKSRTKKENQSDVIYKVPCSNCQATYVGQTTQYLKKRMEAHRYRKNEITALSRHASEQKHGFDFANVEVLDIEQNSFKRKILEMLYIRKDKNSVNNRTDIASLSSIYANIL